MDGSKSIESSFKYCMPRANPFSPVLTTHSVFSPPIPNASMFPYYDYYDNPTSCFSAAPPTINITSAPPSAPHQYVNASMFHYYDYYDNPTSCFSAAPPTINITSAATSHALFDRSNPSLSFSSSLPSNNYFMCPRSTDTHSLTHHTPNPFFSSSLSSASDFINFHSEPVPRVFGAGNLQGMNSIQPFTENCIQGIATARRVGRYSPEERKKRIERYRSKRNKRNFGKKITYPCRKRSADSQRRVRGRFARNEETETETETGGKVEAGTAENSFEGYNHNNFDIGNYDNFDNTGSDGDCWWLILGTNFQLMRKRSAATMRIPGPAYMATTLRTFSPKESKERNKGLQRRPR